MEDPNDLKVPEFKDIQLILDQDQQMSQKLIALIGTHDQAIRWDTFGTP